MGLFELVFGMPTVLYTIVVGICVCYWLLVVGGALGTDLLDGADGAHGGDVSGAAKAIGAAKAAGAMDGGGLDVADASVAAKVLGGAKAAGGGFELDAAAAAKAIGAFDAGAAAKALGAAKAVGFDFDPASAAKAVDAAKAISALLDASAAAKAASGLVSGAAEAGPLAGAAGHVGADAAGHVVAGVAAGSASSAEVLSGSLAGGAIEAGAASEAGGALAAHATNASGSATAAAKAAASELGVHTWKVPLAAKGADGLPAAVAQDPALRVGVSRHNEAFRRPNAGVADGGGLSGFLGLGTVPATVVVSLLSFFGWVAALGLVQTLWPLVAAVAGPIPAHVVTIVLAMLVSIPPTGLAARPLKQVFGLRGAVERTRVLYGRLCTVLSGRVDGGFGQAEFADGGAGLLLNVVCSHPNELKKGALAVIVDYDPTADAYEIEPVDWLLPGETAKDAIDPHALERALQARERQPPGKQRSRS